MKFEKDDLILLYKNMLLGRKVDKLTYEGLQSGKVLGFFHSAHGAEAVGAGVATFLKKDDYLYAHHRGHGIVYIISKGASPQEFLDEHYGKASGCCNGFSGFHFVDPERGCMGAAGTIGSQFPMTLGWGLTAKKNGRGQVAVGCFGDGSSNRGTLHEAFNLSAVWKLPIVWVCNNNGMAQFMPIKDAYPKDDIADLAAGYDMPGVVVDGMDVLAVAEAVQAAVERARAGDGPSMIEAKTLRYRAHSEGSPDVVHNQPRPSVMTPEMEKRDPVTSFERKLIEQKVLTQADIDQIDKEFEEQVAEMDRLATEAPAPEPSVLEGAIYDD
ncbi:MAG: thiamine pyrophosphate-dependent dehydrogenase E1 component subunit alpha [Proteobacteria bacterium]|nr:thiamine pyrophosphate-dependent dehydrogenase E1 component subunit alpha [Pseudomonadota bacterium]